MASEPVCMSCGYPFTGLPSDGDHKVRCPECGTRQYAAMAEPRPTLRALLVWCCSAPFLLCCSCAAALKLEWFPFLFMTSVGAAGAGFIMPMAYSVRIASHARPDSRRAWWIVLFAGWVANALIGAAFMLGALRWIRHL